MLQTPCKRFRNGTRTGLVENPFLTLKRSPDLADAFLLTFACAERRKVDRHRRPPRNHLFPNTNTHTGARIAHRLYSRRHIVTTRHSPTHSYLSPSLPNSRAITGVLKGCRPKMPLSVPKQTPFLLQDTLTLRVLQP
jgi:hypothetical protein